MKKIVLIFTLLMAICVPAYAATLPTLSACSSFAASDIFLARHSTDTSDCKATGTQLKSGLSLNNVENTALSTWAGTANITTLGTIATGSWDGTDIPVTAGGTGRSTSTTAYGLLAAGTTATGVHQTLAAGATTEILVGGGASALPVWTTATGSGSPVRATSPTLTTPNLGTPSTLVLTNATGLPIGGGGTGGTTKLTAMQGIGVRQEYCFAASDQTTDLTTGTAKVTFFFPAAATINSVRAYVNTAPTGSVATWDINEAGSTILSTKITIDASEKTSGTAATAPALSDTSIAANAEMTVDQDGVGSTIKGKGAVVCLDVTF